MSNLPRDGWFVTDQHLVYQLINGSPYRVSADEWPEFARRRMREGYYDENFTRVANMQIDTGWTEEAREAALAARRAAGGAVSAAAAKLGARATSHWLSTSVKAKTAIGKVLTESNVKSAVSLGIKSALYHLGNLDDPAMAVIEPFIEHHVHNIETTLQVTKGRAHDMMMAGVRKLMEARKK